MSNKRKPRKSQAKAELAAIAQILDDQQLAGGCPDCGAYRTFKYDQKAELAVLHVHHDETCPQMLAQGAEPGGTYLRGVYRKGEGGDNA